MNDAASPRLIPVADFEEVVKRVLKVPKKAVDAKVAELHAANKAKRKGKG